MKSSTIQSLIRRQAQGIYMTEQVETELKAVIRNVRIACKIQKVNPKDVAQLTKMYKDLDKIQEYLRKMRTTQKELKAELQTTYKYERFSKTMDALVTLLSANGLRLPTAGCPALD